MTVEYGDQDARAVGPALAKGLRMRCPSCGKGHMFHAYLKVSDTCPACGTELHHHQADDAPAYFTILAVGHVIVPLAAVVERVAMPAMWIHMALWIPLSLATALFSLPRIKGALVALQWALRMHGFDGKGNKMEGHLAPTEPGAAA
ncbi:MAG: DUF983 domain-containing protein [Rhodobiaceae bacterium]|nr:DUF983 domain-containing protein [Rhodobiaceae bacterium]MCC0056998.1 DUF983 domain-containing protein [Rhodobiaceae bacterium]